MNNRNESLKKHAIQPSLPRALEEVGKAASKVAARHGFESYRNRLADETLRRQDADLGLFASFLHQLDLEVGDLAHDPQAWRGITWGLVEAFSQWQLHEGYAVPTINVHLSSVKTYTRLAFQAGMIPAEEYALIRAVRGYSRREQTRLDRRRERTRLGVKKSAPVKITTEQAKMLKRQPDTPQGRRDALIMCLLLDHGLRVGELAGIDADDLELEAGLLHFYRPKVNKQQIHKLSEDTLTAARAYKSHGDLIPGEQLLRRSFKDENLGKPGLTVRSITQRVRLLGEVIGLPGLSAHDCRHYWATTAAKHGTNPFVLQEAGGWNSLAMPRRYVAEQTVANEGIKLEPEKD